MEAYFDNSATTRCYDSVREVVVRTMMNDFGNPSAMHRKGVEAEQYMKNAARTIASLMKVDEKEILFTSGGTESDNLALAGTAMAARRSGNHIITTAVEHAAVREPAAFLERQGFRVTYLPVDERGVVRMDSLEEALDEDTILVSVMHVNNEVGAVMPLADIGPLVHKKAPGALFHVDAVQGFGKYEIFPRKWGVDLLSVSSHKIHGPKGAGFLYIRSGAKVLPQILGGGQQNGMRSGTDNVPGAAGMAAAAEQIYRNIRENTEHLYSLKKRLSEGLSALPEVFINGPSLTEGAPHILSASFTGVRSEVLLHSLEERDIYVSAGSACSTHKRRPSATLTAMGLPAGRIESTVRFSFSEENTEEQVDYCLQVLSELLPMLRRYSRR